MTIRAGTRLGPYEVIAPIGAGGMGEVYKAKDTRLDRIVAIKVLPEHLAESPERKARFEREAKAISQLNHPHICTLYDVGEQDGVHYLVMEYIEGETLAERLKKGALKLDEALEYGIQIADGLDKAHRAGIVHRDLKPGNVMLTKPGVKLLDFGLAKHVQETPLSEGSDAPTQQRQLTGEQAIVGTLQYMAPEQLEGGQADARTDVFAFGAVLYEMLTGRKAFDGESEASLISAIMSAEPGPPSELAPILPRPLDRLVQKCLAKAPDDRWQTARDVTTEMEWIRSHGDGPSDAPASGVGKKSRWALLGALVLLAGLALAGWLRPVNEDRASLVSRMVIPLPEGLRLVERRSPPIAISPNGRRIVYAAETSEGSRLYLRPLDAFESTPITGTEGGHSPFFAPDGEWVGFFTDTELKKVALSGGRPTAIAPAELGSLGGSWGPDDTIVYAPSSGAASSLLRVASSGGRPERLTRRSFRGQAQHPQVLPDGKTVLFTRVGNDNSGAWILSLAGESESELDFELLGPSVLLYLPTGHLLRAASSDTSLDIVPFDFEAKSTRGEPFPILYDVVMNRGSTTTGAPYLAFSETGTLVYVAGDQRSERLVRVDRQGNARALNIEGAAHAPRFSPDGSRIAYNSAGDAFVYDIARETRTRLSNFGGMVVWSPDGQNLLGTGPDGLYRRPSDGSGAAERLFAREYFAGAESWSRDGRLIAVTENHPESLLDVWIYAMDDEPRPFLVTEAAENAAQFSPDGRYLAYQSNESGAREVYVRPFPEGNARWKISSKGGTAPVWSPDGSELYYREGSAVMVVDVATGEDFSAGRPRALFDGDFVVDNTGHPGYDIAPDGESFVMIQQRREAPLTEIHVVQNWFEEIRQLVPNTN